MIFLMDQACCKFEILLTSPNNFCGIVQGVAESECMRAADKAENLYSEEYNSDIVPEENVMRKEHDVSPHYFWFIHFSHAESYLCLILHVLFCRGLYCVP